MNGDLLITMGAGDIVTIENPCLVNNNPHYPQYYQHFYKDTTVDNFFFQSFLQL